MKRNVKDIATYCNFMDLIYNPKSHKLLGGNVYDKQLGNVNLARIFNDIKELFFIIFRYNTCILIMLLKISYLLEIYPKTFMDK